MLIMPTFKKLWRNKWPGVVQSRAANGYFLRRATRAVNPRTPKRQLWRQIFGNSRKGWLAIAPGGADYVVVGGLEPQQAWETECTNTSNVLQNGLYEGNVLLSGQLANVGDPLAYFTAVQSLLAALGLPPRPTPTFTTVGGLLTPTLYTPTFQLPNKLSCKTSYDQTFAVNGFNLSYSVPDPTIALMTRNGTPIIPQWQLNASPVYTSIYSPPDASEIVPISYNVQIENTGLPTSPAWAAGAVSVLDAFIAAYGPLPASGYIKFIATPIDPITGVAGPGLTVTASFSNGTFRGGAASAWLGNKWNITYSTTPLSIAAPGSASITLTIQPTPNTGDPTTTNPWMTSTNIWPPGYTFPVTMTPELIAKAYLTSTYMPNKKAAIPGLTATFSPTALTFASGGAAAQGITVTINADATTPPDTYTVQIEVTDGLFELFATVTLTVTNSAFAGAPFEFVGMDHTVYSVGLVANNSVTFPVTLENTGPDDVSISMLSATQTTDVSTSVLLSNTPYSITWDNQNPTVPGGTVASPGSVTVHCTIVTPPNVDTAVVQTQIAATTGVQSTYATVI